MGLQGEEWKEKKAEIASSFSGSRLKSFHEKSQKILKLFENFIREQEKSNFNATDLSSKFFAAVFEKLIFANDSTFSVEKSEMQKMAEKLSLKTSFANFLKIMLVTALPFMREKIQIQYLKPDDQQNFIDKITKALQKDESFLAQLKNLKKENSEASHTIPFLSHGLEVSSIALGVALYEVELIKLKRSFYFLK
jgi:glutamyl/glutaminyl-tRNA synthetase